jgi:hypothetical protein
MFFRTRFFQLNLGIFGAHSTRTTSIQILLVKLTLAITAVGAYGCKSQNCVPGQQVACACPGETRGIQACDAEGSRYLPCICAAPATPALATIPNIVVPPQKKQIRCGPLFCDNACCATFDPPTCSNNPRACARTDQGEAVIYECDGPEDCGAKEACCLVPGKTVIAAVCTPRKECSGSFPHPRYGQVVSAKKVCHGNGDCDVSEICGDSGDSKSILTCNK